MEDRENLAGTGTRAPYSTPVFEDLGSLRELTAAGGPSLGVDSAYIHGTGNFGVS